MRSALFFLAAVILINAALYHVTLSCDTTNDIRVIEEPSVWIAPTTDLKKLRVADATPVKTNNNTKPAAVDPRKIQALSTASFADIDPNGIKDSTSAMQKLFSHGGELLVLPGKYLISRPLLLSSNTMLICLMGATFYAAASWSGNKNGPLIANLHYDANSIADDNISITGCGANLTKHQNGSWHSFAFIGARHIKIDRVACTEGGDCTSMQATSDTIVENSSARGMTNACWDHWNAPSNFVVKNNRCSTLLYGILATGTDTSHTSSGQALDGDISENTIFINSNALGAGIWLNGLGAKGSGASNIKVSNNYIMADTTAKYVCLYLTGNSVNNIFSKNTCQELRTKSIGFIATEDSGGKAHDDLAVGNLFYGVRVSRKTLLIRIAGDRIRFYGNFISDCYRETTILIAGIDDQVLNNYCGPDANIRVGHLALNEQNTIMKSYDCGPMSVREEAPTGLCAVAVKGAP